MHSTADRVPGVSGDNNKPLVLCFDYLTLVKNENLGGRISPEVEFLPRLHVAACT